MDHNMMDMSMSMPTATATGDAASSTMAGMSHSGGDGAAAMTMDMSQMAMVFFQSATSPLFSKAWTPAGTGSYAGTCIFLVVLAALHRVLIAVRNIVFCDPSVPSLRGHPKLERRSSSMEVQEGAVDPAVVTYRLRYGLGRDGVMTRIRCALRDNPFRIATETARAFSELVTSGIGYLLMLAVMTMNVGYFLSVLGGIFLGAFLAGRFGTADH
ncbi:uncharacterized protein PG998_011621 [Apiospora kogelbergensis]|uniref:uncharacterized protein n=1 Tax=Apiospora kogelbergensis TaxID=1337665 RepID=UPI00313190AF